MKKNIHIRYVSGFLMLFFLLSPLLSFSFAPAANYEQSGLSYVTGQKEDSSKSFLRFICEEKEGEDRSEEDRSNEKDGKSAYYILFALPVHELIFIFDQSAQDYFQAASRSAEDLAGIPLYLAHRTLLI